MKARRCRPFCRGGAWLAAPLLLLLAATRGPASESTPPRSYSGIYPHLATFNNEGECGTGAVVPWADRLWVVSYGPHQPAGSSDKLYEITPSLEQIVRPESIGGTPANRLIHRESNQLFIGPYAIDAQGRVRVIPYSVMPGRHTGSARHLTDPANKIYTGTMEEGFYEVDVHSLAVKTLYPDKNGRSAREAPDILPGCHGKGFYSGQGRVIYANNGESSAEAIRNPAAVAGVLAEWDGTDWHVVRRNQFTEVTGPGGIYGNPHPATDPIWALGWDVRSLLLGLRDGGKWTFFRLPKASHTYDGGHGWHTEWPRIRDIGAEGKPDLLMTMHGMFWRFPITFSLANTAGIRPRSAYLKVIGDFARWRDQIVFGCDDTAKSGFLGKRQADGGIARPGQSQSNLWFTDPETPSRLGPTSADGSVWLRDPVKAGQPSDPFLFAGWDRRGAWLANDGQKPVSFTFEVDALGRGTWRKLRAVLVPARGSVWVGFRPAEGGEWIRVRTDRDTTATVHFSYADERRSPQSDPIFTGLAPIAKKDALGGLLLALGQGKRTLGLAAQRIVGGQVTDAGYYELDGAMALRRVEAPAAEATIRTKVAIPRSAVVSDEASILVVDEKGRRWRLPKGDAAYEAPTREGQLRVCREVVTERDLFDCHGTFYEVPAETADGYAKIRPVASHHFRVADYASYRGLLVLTGIDPAAAAGNPHVILSDDGKAAVWAGALDDLWKLGKPVGQGGPWKDTAVQPGQPSDPYLFGFYDRRKLVLSQQSGEAVNIRVEVDPTGHGPWMLYRSFRVAPGEKVEYSFPEELQARWIRFTADRPTTATAWLTYE